MAKQTHKRSKHFQIPYSHFGRNGLAFPLTEAMTCAITLFKRTRSTVRNESYKRRWQSQVLAPFSHPNEVQKPQTVKISTGNNECPNVQTSHPLFIRVVTWVLQITPLTKEREPERDERDYPAIFLEICNVYLTIDGIHRRILEICWKHF